MVLAEPADELRQALAPEMQDFWTAIRPSGSVDQVDVELIWDPARSDLDPVFGVACA